MNIILTINVIVAVVFACCYAYQLFFLAVPFTRKQEAHKPEVLHRFAILICARNESAVIADLLQSIQHQSYDQSLITTFVMAAGGIGGAYFSAKASICFTSDLRDDLFAKVQEFSFKIQNDCFSLQ